MAVMHLDQEVLRLASWAFTGYPANDLARRRLAVLLQHIVNEQRKHLLDELPVRGLLS